MEQEGRAGHGLLRRGQPLRLRRHLVEAQPGDGGKLLRRVRRVLPRGEVRLIPAHAGDVPFAPCRPDGAEAGLLPVLALLPGGAGGVHQHPAAVGILQQDLLQQAFKISLPTFAAQIVKEASHAEIRPRLAAVDPTLQHLEAQNQALGHSVVVALPGLKLQVVQHGENPPPVQAFPGQPLQL